jgi:hypothetical protein
LQNAQSAESHASGRPAHRHQRADAKALRLLALHLAARIMMMMMMVMMVMTAMTVQLQP